MAILGGLKHLRQVPLLFCFFCLTIFFAVILLVIPSFFPSMNASPLKGNARLEIINADDSREPLKGPNPMQGMKDVVFTKESMEVKKHLNIAVPNKSGFKEFVDWSLDSNNQMVFSGYSIDVFREALREMDYKLNYSFFPFGNGTSTPIYDDMIDSLYNGTYDAVVGDVTIRSNRARKVDFTQAYSESGLVVIALVKDDHFSGVASFTKPFTSYMWLTTMGCLIFTGIVVWFIEHRDNIIFQGRLIEKAKTIFWFMGSTIFFAHREPLRSGLAQLAVIMWLFAVVILVSSYTASLSSILTVQNIHPSIDGIEELKRSSVRIGYQTGSFVKYFLIQEHHIAKERLVSLSTMEDYAEALRLGPEHQNGVGAIVDELPYAQSFLSTQCDFMIAGEVFTRSGLGYAFPMDSKVGKDVSLAILQLSESGRLQEIHDRWMSTKECRKLQVRSNKLGPENFIGLFLSTLTTSLLCMLIHIGILWRQFQNQGGFPNNQPILETLRRFYLYINQHINITHNQFALEILRGFVSNVDFYPNPRNEPNQVIIPQILRLFLSYMDQLNTPPNEYPHQTLKKFVSYLDLHNVACDTIPEILRKFVLFMDLHNVDHNESNQPTLRLLRNFVNYMDQHNVPLDEFNLLTLEILRLFFRHIDNPRLPPNQSNLQILREFVCLGELPANQPIIITLRNFVSYLNRHNLVI